MRNVGLFLCTLFYFIVNLKLISVLCAAQSLRIAARPSFHPPTYSIFMEALWDTQQGDMNGIVLLQSSMRQQELSNEMVPPPEVQQNGETRLHSIENTNLKVSMAVTHSKWTIYKCTLYIYSVQQVLRDISAATLSQCGRCYHNLASFARC